MIFRSELAILLGLILFLELWRGGVAFTTVLRHVLPAGVALLGLYVYRHRDLTHARHGELVLCDTSVYCTLGDSVYEIRMFFQVPL